MRPGKARRAMDIQIPYIIRGTSWFGHDERPLPAKLALLNLQIQINHRELLDARIVDDAHCGCVCHLPSWTTRRTYARRAHFPNVHDSI